MTPMLYIREKVFRVPTQEAWADIVGVAQSTVSRWESGESTPTSVVLLKLRRLASAHELEWNDDWFFEAPSTTIEEAAE